MENEMLYSILPYHIKVFIASNYGYYLKYLRYSGKFYQYRDEAVQRESWTKEKWDNWQEEKIEYILETAYKYVPYYQEYWRARKKRGDNSSYKLIENWPVINKSIIQKNPEYFINTNYNKCQLIIENTSGSTGTPLKVYHSKDSLRYWYGLCEVRWRNWYGLSLKQSWAYIAGRKIVPYYSQKPPFWVWNKGLNQLYLSCYHLKEKNILFYIDALRKYKIVNLYGLASSIHQLAYLGKKMGICPPPIKAVVSCAETLYPNHRKDIEDFFSCPVYDSYGSTEKVVAASECKQKTFHLWPDVGKVEIINCNKNIVSASNNFGKLICTGLFNDAMPLIRYEINDVGVIDEYESCACGRAMPILKSLDGRYDDMILTKDGRRVMIIWSFLNDLPIIELQVIQKDIENIWINYVPHNKLDAEDERKLVSRLEENLGEFNFHLYPVASIDRGNNGKFKAVISKL